MISLRDCMEYLHLTVDEIDAIAEHEHVPPIIAAELGAYLVEDANGERMLKRMILDDIMHAANQGDVARVEHLTTVLKHFVATHPDLD
ncbi:MAG: hypothetical protein H6977_03860 [Gammaproteobacteria bacterium]|nr:hypothetical protein [Gammaproteobacteria bacterium]MCP5199123.1 hypothetical protein [Gammaproteobacteria bacterium]